MGKFGWSYPPGCSGPPDDDYPEPSPLVESVLELLETAGAPQDVNDRVVQIIEEWERSPKPLRKIGNVTSVNIETGEETPAEGGMYMMPAAPGACETCCTHHEPELPHNQQSLSYQMAFHAEHGRWPTWTDAMAHCTPETREMWKEALIDTLTKNGMEIPDDLKS